MTAAEDDLVGQVVEFEIFYPNDSEDEIKLLSISPNAGEVFGYGLSAWQRPDDQWHQMLHPGDYARAVTATWALGRLGTPLSIECRVVRADGEVLWVLDEATIAPQEDGEIWRGTMTVIAPPETPGWTPVSLGSRIVSVLGAEGARGFLGTLERSEAERAALIGTLSLREDTEWLAGLLTDLEMDEQARLRVAGGLRTALGPT